MIRTYTLTHNGTHARVTAKYYPGFPGTREDPPEEESCEITAVKVEGVDIAYGLTYSELTALEAAWLEAWHDEERAHIDDIQNEQNYVDK